MNQNCNQKSCRKKCLWLALIIILAFIVGMVISNSLNHKVAPQSLTPKEQASAEEFLPLLDAQKKLQEPQESIKLNVDPQVKEGW